MALAVSLLTWRKISDLSRRPIHAFLLNPEATNITAQRPHLQTDRKPTMVKLNSYTLMAFSTRSDMSGVKGIIGMHRFNICLVVVLSLSCRCLALV